MDAWCAFIAEKRGRRERLATSLGILEMNGGTRSAELYTGTPRIGTIR